MKKGLFIVSVVSMVLAFSCSSMRDALSEVTGIAHTTGEISNGISATSGSSSGTAGSASAVVEFKAGEVLGTADTGNREDANYSVGKILTPASAATKNQAEFLYVSDGSKQWVNHTVVSRKAVKSDFAVGVKVLVLAGWADHENIGAESYRKDRWVFGTVTNVDELFKNRVEVSGSYYYINYVRIETK